MKEKLEGTGYQIQYRSKEFPIEPIERMNALLSCVNIGPKAALLFILPPPGLYIQPYPELSSSFFDLIKGTSMQGVSNSTPIGYCEQSLCNVGLVATAYQIEYFGTEKTIGYSLTSEGGERYGLPATALALLTEDKHSISLYSVLGSINTHQNGPRAPLTRARVLMFLAKQSKEISEMEIGKHLGISIHSIDGALKELAMIGVIEGEGLATHTGKVTVSYEIGKLSPDNISPVNRDNALTSVIAEISIKLASQNIPISRALIYDHLPQAIKDRRRKDVLKNNISTILSGLATQEFLVRIHGLKGGKVQSYARITEKGMGIVNDFLLPLEKIVSDDSVEQKKQNARLVAEVRRNLGYFVRKSTELYYPHSKGYKVRQAEDNKSRIFKLLSESNRLTAQDLAPVLGVDENTVQAYLGTLVKSKRLFRQLVNGVFYYSITTDSA